MILEWLSKNKTAVFIVLGLLVADGFLWSSILKDQQSDSAELYFFNVGQGDSQLLVLPEAGGQSIKVLVDGGPTGAVLDALARALPATDRRIDVVIMTHPHLDHFGGLIDVLSLYDVGVFIGSGRRADVTAYRGLHEALIASEVPYIQVGEGDAITVGEYRLAILSPSSQEFLGGDLNDTSLAFILSAPEFKAFFAGDIGEGVEERLVRDYDINADILKVGHHGSRFSSSRPFLAEVSPEISVIEVGKNTYGHPAKEALDRLDEFSQNIFRTDTDGLVKIIYASGSFAAYQVTP